MRKLLVLFQVFILVIMLAFSTGCDLFGDDDDDSMLEYVMMDLMTGNCVEIIKDTATDQYIAIGTLTPKGNCKEDDENMEMRITTDLSEAKRWSDEYYDENIALLSNKKNTKAALSGCELIVISFESIKKTVTTTSIENDANLGYTLNTAIKCTYVRNGYFCISEDEASKLEDLFDSILSMPSTIETRYHTVSDVKTDMTTSLNYYRDNPKIPQAASGFTEKQLNNGTIYSKSDMDIDDEYLPFWRILSSPGIDNDNACRTAFLEKHIRLRNLLVRVFGNSFSAFGITANDTAAVTTPLVAEELDCGYGTGFTASNTAGQCPDSYPTW